MVEKRLNLKIRGIPVPMTIRYRLRNWRHTLLMEQLKIKDPTWLVQYDTESQIATLDAEAPGWYIDLAALHETICCGNLYVDDINRLTDFNIIDDMHRCANTERFILSIAGDHREEYIDARVKMFELILSKNLNAELADQMRETLEMLRQAA